MHERRGSAGSLPPHWLTHSSGSQRQSQPVREEQGRGVRCVSHRHTEVAQEQARISALEQAACCRCTQQSGGAKAPAGAREEED